MNMGIEKHMARRCAQTAVYWGNPVNDGFSNFTFDAPIEVQCRWQDKVQILGQQDETQTISRAIVMVTQDMDEDGMLYLGTLASLTTAQKADPKTIDKAYVIKRFEKSPAVGSNSVFLRKVHLTPWLG